jgi:hypothetical protein
MNRRKYPPSRNTVNKKTPSPEVKKLLRWIPGLLPTILAFVGLWVPYKAQQISISQACIARVDTEESRVTEKTGALTAALGVFVSKTINPAVSADAYYSAAEKALYAARELSVYAPEPYRDKVMHAFWGVEDLMQISAHLKPRELERQSIIRFNLLAIGYDEYRRSKDEERRLCTQDDPPPFVNEMLMRYLIYING